jgi:hypothetical protein
MAAHFARRALRHVLSRQSLALILVAIAAGSAARAHSMAQAGELTQLWVHVQHTEPALGMVRRACACIVV